MGIILLYFQIIKISCVFKHTVSKILYQSSVYKSIIWGYFAQQEDPPVSNQEPGGPLHCYFSIFTISFDSIKGK